MRIRLLLIFILALFNPSEAFAQHSEIIRGELGRKIDAFITGLSHKGYSGAVLVAKNGEIVLQKGYGLADRERNIRNMPETLFSVASVSKTFTAAATLQLEEKGKLHTSDPISRHLGAFPKRKMRQPYITCLLTLPVLLWQAPGLTRAVGKLLFNQ